MVSVRASIRLLCLLILCLQVQGSEIDVFTAAERGDFEVVKEAVDNDPLLITKVDNRGYGLLHKATYNNHTNIAEYLISQGADINAASGSGSTPLHGAAYYGHQEAVRLLLDAGADVEMVNAAGYTPLLSACAGNQGAIARLLVERGANFNIRAGNGHTPLLLAVWNADAELTGFLLEKGADANIQTDMGVSLPYFATALRDSEFSLMLMDKAADFAETDTLGLGMLHYAAARGFSQQVRKLLKGGVDVNARDVFGRTPMFYALLWGHDEVAGILKAHRGTADDIDRAWFRGDFLGRPVPGKTPVEFVGDELRTPFAPHGRMAFSPDGKEMFWCHQAMPIQAMWYTKQADGSWQRPVIAPFTDPALDFADGNPCFSGDGSRVYYHTHRRYADSDERKEDADIWYAEKTDGVWGNPTPLGPPVNTDKNELGPATAPSGNLYFTGGEYEGSYGTEDIYVSEFIDGVYTRPRNLGPNVNSEYHELSPMVPSDESYIIFVTDRPMLNQRSLKLCVSFLADGQWTPAVPIGRTVNRGHTWQPFLTSDDKFVFYQQGTQYYWFGTELIEDIRRAVVGPGDVRPDIRIPLLRKSEQVFEHAATNDIAVGDLDGDGDLDAVFSNMGFNESRVYLNDGQGQFTVTEDILTQQGHGVDLGDVDGDGDLDIFITCAGYGAGGVESTRPSRVYFNNGKGSFTVSPQDFGDSLSSGNDVKLVDIDTDGDLDALVVYYEEDNGVYLNDGKGQFIRSDLSFPTGAHWADLDGDGDVDILYREPGAGFKTLINDGSGYFDEYWSAADSSVNRGGVALGDFDSDGDLDAVIAHLDQSEHRYSTLWYNDGSGRFSETDVKLPLTRYARLTVGDLNGDGHADVFVNNFGLPSAVWLNDGHGRLFDCGIRLPGEWQNTSCPLGDLDGDGDLDVFIAAYGGGPNEVWFIQ